MNKLLFILFTVIAVSCSQKSNNNSTGSQTEPTPSSKQVASAKATSTSFDIAAVSISNADIGAFPYLSAPQGYEYSGTEQNKKYEEKYFFYNDSLVMTIGGKYYHTMIVAKKGEEFSETYVVKNYEQAIKKIGGVEVYSGRIVDKASDLLKSKEVAYAKDMYDPYPYSYKQFVVKTANGNVWIELCHGLNMNGIDFTVMYDGK